MKALSRNLIIAILGILFLAPGSLALYFFYHPQLLGTSTINKGAFMTPPIKVEGLNSLTKTPTKIDNKWFLVLWNQNDCGDLCLQSLDKLMRIRLAMGREYFEVGEILLTEQESSTLSGNLKAALEKNIITTLQLNHNLFELGEYRKNQRIFIADSQGYLVLSYSPDVNPDNIYQDLKRLMKSH